MWRHSDGATDERAQREPPVTSGNLACALSVAARSTVSAEAEVHLDLRDGGAARKSPRRIAGRGIGIAGQVELPGFLGNTGELEAYGPSAGLPAERRTGEDHSAIAISAVPAFAEYDAGVPPRGVRAAALHRPPLTASRAPA